MSAREYALCRGEEFVDAGTVEELAERMGVRPRAVLFYTHPSWRRRSAGYRSPTVVVELEGREERDE